MSKINTDSSQVFLAVGTVAKRYAVSENTVWRWLREGNFPKPKRLGQRSTRWRLADLESWEER